MHLPFSSTARYRRWIRVGFARAALLGAAVAVGGLTASLPVSGQGTAPALKTPPPADAVVAAAVKTARARNKAVLIEFGASWCVWCRNFETFVTAPDTAPIIASQFEVVNLVVQEAEEKIALEHPGGREAMTRWGGARAGLPFYVFLDGNGRKIADSNAMPGGGNIGFPAVKEEIDAFMRLIDRTAPSLKKTDRDALEAHLVRGMKSSGPAAPAAVVR